MYKLYYNKYILNVNLQNALSNNQNNLYELY